jgi:hypothetical protein
MNGAGAALRDAAAVLGAGEADVVPQDPRQGAVGLDIDRHCLPMTYRSVIALAA